MAGKGGKGGGTNQPALRGGGTLSNMLGGMGGGGGGGFMDMLRQGFQPPQQQPQFAPVPPPMQTPGQQFSPFNGQPITHTAGEFGGGGPTGGPTPGGQQFTGGMPISRQAPPQGGGQLDPNQFPISRAAPPQGGGQQFAPQGTPFHGTPNPGFAPFNPPPIGAGQGRQRPFAPASPLGPLVNPRGGQRGAPPFRKGAF